MKFSNLHNYKCQTKFKRLQQFLACTLLKKCEPLSCTHPYTSDPLSFYYLLRYSAFHCRELISGQKTAIIDRRVHRREDAKQKAAREAKERAERKAFRKAWRLAQKNIEKSKIRP